MPSWDAARTGSIAFKIRTNEANGVLMYNTGATAQGDFFAFELLDGHVFLLLNLGSGAVKVSIFYALHCTFSLLSTAIIF